ncbi:MAG: translation initiation factor [Nanoarchaeota archaeon]|nr:translation initiation factor [Nanoarchaeota archaeon]
MVERDPITGLPKELDVWENIAKSEQRIQVKLEKRKFGKIITVIVGLDAKAIDIKDVAKQLKSKLACGGTVKGNNVELQGNHKTRAKEELVNMGFAEESID